MSEKLQEYIMDICVAYEEGYAVGDVNMSASFNKYPSETDKYYAWYYGHTNSLTNQMLQNKNDKEITFEME